MSYRLGTSTFSEGVRATTQATGAQAADRGANTVTPEGRDSEFRAVSGGPEIASGPVLLVEAYAAIWILLFGFIAIGWRRTRRLEARLTELERTVASASHGAPARAGAASEAS